MRTTIDIEDDVLETVKELARLQNISAGQVVSKLLEMPWLAARPKINLKAERLVDSGLSRHGEKWLLTARSISCETKREFDAPMARGRVAAQQRGTQRLIYDGNHQTSVIPA